MAQPRDQAIDLDAWQLAALARLGTLCHLNFDFLTIIQIFRRHPETSGCDLFNRAGWVIAIFTQFKPRRILATFARVRFRTDTVHRNRQCFMCLRAQRAKRDSRRYQTFAYNSDRFHLFNLNRILHRFEI